MKRTRPKLEIRKCDLYADSETGHTYDGNDY